MILLIRSGDVKLQGKLGQSDSVRWLFNDEEYSFSGLAQAILEQASDHKGSCIRARIISVIQTSITSVSIELRNEILSGELTSVVREN